MLNAESLVCHFDEIKYFITVNKPMVMCLTETHVTVDIEECELNINNYKLISLNSESRHTGGVIFYVQSDIKYRVVSMEILGENTWLLAVKMKINNKDITLCGLYHSPNQSHADFLKMLEEWLEQQAFDLSHLFLLMGDFNLNWSGTNQYSNKLKKCMSDFGLIQILLISIHVLQI